MPEAFQQPETETNSDSWFYAAEQRRLEIPKPTRPEHVYAPSKPAAEYYCDWVITALDLNFQILGKIPQENQLSRQGEKKAYP